LAAKENVNPAPLMCKIGRLEGKVAAVESQLQVEKAKTAEARTRCQNTRQRETRAQEANVALGDRLKSTEAIKDDLLAAQLALGKSQYKVSKLLTCNSTLVKRAKALSMRIRRTPTIQARAVEKAKAVSHLFRLQQKGVIMEASRELVTDLVSLHNVPVSRVLSVICSVAATLGVQFDGDISERSIGRIVLEGGLISQAQIVHEIQSTAGKSSQSKKRKPDINVS
jgi:outer membrane murein-binding lipoprotein Lpp